MTFLYAKQHHFSKNINNQDIVYRRYTMIDERKQLDDRASVGFCKKGFISHIIMCKIYIYMIKKVATILQRNKKKRL